jgi:hypothetical protein
MKFTLSIATLFFISLSLSQAQPTSTATPAKADAQISAKEEHEKADQNPNADTSKDLRENLDQGLHIQAKPKVDRSKEVWGSCEIVRSGDQAHAISDACVETQLILKDALGKELARTRTDAKGQFDFAADPGKRFKIQPASPSYDLLAPTKLVYSGTEVHVKLRLHP